MLAFFAGLTAIYAGAFLYENEEGRLENKLEELWSTFHDLEKVSLSRHSAFMRQITGLAARGLDGIFGSRLFSVEACLMSLLYSCGFGSIVWATLFLDKYRVQGSPLFGFWDKLSYVGGGLLLLLVAALLPEIVPRADMKLFGKSMILGCTVLFGILIVLAVKYPYLSRNSPVRPGLLSGLMIFHVPLAVSFMVDVMFVALTRWSLRWCSDMRSALNISCVILVNCVLATLLVGIPLALQSAGPLGTEFGRALAGLNAWDVAASLFVLTLAFLAIVHKLFWPLINRPMYVLATRAGARHKLLLTAGLALLAFSTSGALEFLNKAVGNLR